MIATLAGPTAKGIRNGRLTPTLIKRHRAKRPLSLPMIRKLHQGLGIPAEVLGRIRSNRQLKLKPASLSKHSIMEFIRYSNE